MFIDEIRIDYIFFLLFGYNGAIRTNYAGCSINDIFHLYFQDWVVKWIQKNVDEQYEKSNIFWYHAFQDVTDSNSDAVDMFFSCAKDFFEAVHLKIQDEN